METRVPWNAKSRRRPGWCQPPSSQGGSNGVRNRRTRRVSVCCAVAISRFEVFPGRRLGAREVGGHDTSARAGLARRRRAVDCPLRSSVTATATTAIPADDCSSCSCSSYMRPADHPSPRAPPSRSRRRCRAGLDGGLAVYSVVICRTPAGAAAFRFTDDVEAHERLVGALGSCNVVSIGYPDGTADRAYVCPNSVVARARCDPATCSAFIVTTERENPEWCRAMTARTEDGLFAPCEPLTPSG